MRNSPIISFVWAMPIIVGLAGCAPMTKEEAAQINAMAEALAAAPLPQPPQMRTMNCTTSTYHDQAYTNCTQF